MVPLYGGAYGKTSIGTCRGLSCRAPRQWCHRKTVGFPQQGSRPNIFFS